MATLTIAINLALALTAAVSLTSLSECRLLPIPLTYNENEMVQIQLTNSDFGYKAIFSTDEDFTHVSCSTNAQPILCSDPRCQSFSESNCNASKASSSCSFNLTFANVSGVIATEHVAPFGTMVVGCINIQSDQLLTPVAVAAGFGASRMSIPGQLNVTKLAYCLSNNSRNNGMLRMGDAAKVADGIALPLQQDNTKSKRSLHVLGVDSMMVGTNTSNTKIANTGGRMLLSTRMPWTLLPRKVHDQLKFSVLKWIGNRMNATKVEEAEVCYDTDDGTVPEYFPDIALKWNKSAVQVSKESAFKYFRSVSSLCLAVVPTSDEAMLGLYWQRGMTVAVDTNAKTATFKNTGGSCV